jgi:hypothetical protein
MVAVSVEPGKMDGMDGMDGVRVVCDASQRRLRKSFFFLSPGSWKGSLKARAKVSLWSGARAENVGDPQFVADETLTKPDASIPLRSVHPGRDP